VPPERQYYRQATGPDFQQPTGTPTEVENKPAEPGSAAPAPAAPPTPAKPESK
jgi:hypothetical protein